MSTKETAALQLIYHRPKGADIEALESTAVYEILYFFSETGPVGHGMLEQVSQQLYQKPAAHPVAFSSVDDLKDFALAVCQAMHAPEIFVLSVQDYNIGV